MIRRRIFNKEIKKRVIKIRIGLIKWLYIKKDIRGKRRAPLGIKKATYLKGGTVSPII